MWMMIEGFHIYVTLLNLKSGDIKHDEIIMYVIGYGVPIVICLVTVIVTKDEYALQDNCWLSTNVNWTFKIPVYCIIAFNLGVFFFSIFLMCKHTCRSSRYTSTVRMILTWIRGSAMILTILGIPWLFETFSEDDSTIFLSYLFVILCSFQGVFIFIFYCLLDSKVVLEYRRLLDRNTCLPVHIKRRLTIFSAPAIAIAVEDDTKIENTLGAEINRVLFGEPTLEQEERENTVEPSVTNISSEETVHHRPYLVEVVSGAVTAFFGLFFVSDAKEEEHESSEINYD